MGVKYADLTEYYPFCTFYGLVGSQLRILASWEGWKGRVERGGAAAARGAERSATGTTPSLLNTGRSPPSVHAHGRLHVEARRARREDGRDCAA